MKRRAAEIPLRTWTPREPDKGFKFYILSKGYNAGRPLDKPCPNCFVVNCNGEQQRNDLYGICSALFHARSFHYYLCGSVVEFIHIRHAEGLINHAYQKFQKDPEGHRKTIETLYKIDQWEKNNRRQLEVVRELRTSLAHKHFGSHPDFFGKGAKLSP